MTIFHNIDGSINLSQIAEEFGGSQPINLSDYYRGGQFVPDFWTNTDFDTPYGRIPLLSDNRSISIGQFIGKKLEASAWEIRGYLAGANNVPDDFPYKRNADFLMSNNNGRIGIGSYDINSGVTANSPTFSITHNNRYEFGLSKWTTIIGMSSGETVTNSKIFIDDVEATNSFRSSLIPNNRGDLIITRVNKPIREISTVRYSGDRRNSPLGLWSQLIIVPGKFGISGSETGDGRHRYGHKGSDFCVYMHNDIAIAISSAKKTIIYADDGIMHEDELRQYHVTTYNGGWVNTGTMHNFYHYGNAGGSGLIMNTANSLSSVLFNISGGRGVPRIWSLSQWFPSDYENRPLE